MGSTPSKKRKNLVMKINAVSALRSKQQCNRILKQQPSNMFKTDMQNANHFVQRRSIRGDGHRLSYADTTVAWNALRQTFKQYQRQNSKSSMKAVNSLQRQASVDSGSDIECNHNEENPMLRYGIARKIFRAENCHICNVNDSRKEPLHGCRICNKIYHHVCLEVGKFLIDDISLAAVAESETSIGWSCPNCENLLNLLSDQEKTEVIEAFEKMAGDDTSVDVVRYLAKRKLSYQNLVGIPMTSQREKQEIDVFNHMDRDNSGTIEWWEYVPTMCIRILSRRTQEELLELATEREIAKLEKHFKKFDESGDGIITLTPAKMAYGKWLLSLIKEKEDGYIPDEWIGELPNEWTGVHEVSPIPYKGKKKKETTVSWRDFLLVNSLHLLCARPNTVGTRPFLPTIDEALSFLNADRDIRLDEGIEEELVDDIDPLLSIKMRLNNISDNTGRS